MNGRCRPPLLALLGLLTVGSAGAGPRLAACIDFGCRTAQPVVLPEDAWEAIARSFAAVDSAAAERGAIAAAIARLETEVGRQTDTWQDLGRNWRRAGEPGELDCIAESRNTSLYLKTLEEAGLLRWHRTRERIMRGIFMVHWTAVLEAVDDGSHWAVDSWYRDNGQPPVILPLAQWYDYSGPDS